MGAVKERKAHCSAEISTCTFDLLLVLSGPPVKSRPDTTVVEPPKLPVRRRDNPWMRRALIFVTCVLLADALFGDRGFAQTLRIRRDHRQAIAALAAIRNENAALRELRRRLAEDPGAIEAVARQELGLIRPGEILVVIKDR